MRLCSKVLHGLYVWLRYEVLPGVVGVGVGLNGTIELGDKVTSKDRPVPVLVLVPCRDIDISYDVSSYQHQTAATTPSMPK